MENMLTITSSMGLKEVMYQTEKINNVYRQKIIYLWKVDKINLKTANMQFQIDTGMQIYR